MISTYMTSAEATIYFNDADYAAGAKSQALADSFGLVNSYISSALIFPAVGEWDGKSAIIAPTVLKILQSQFYEWCLLRGNIGETPEVKAIYDSAREKCQALTQNELLVPGAQTPDKQVGWKITEYSAANATGMIEVRGTPPDRRTFYRILTTHTGTVYAGSVVYSVFRADSSTALLTGQTGSYDWKSVPTVTNPFEIRWDGQWPTALSIYITGTPEEDVNVRTPQKNIITQAPLSY